MKKDFKKIALLALLAAAGPSQAGLLDGLEKGANALTGSSSPTAPAMSIEDLDSQLSSLSTRFVAAMRAMLTAQGITMSAMGLKDQAAKLDSEAKSLEGKNDLNTVSRSIAVSQEASKEIDNKLAKSNVVGAEAKVELAKATPHYAKGISDSVQLPGEYSKWMSNAEGTVSAMQSNPAMALKLGSYVSKVKEVSSVTGKLPALIGAWKTTTSNFVNFSKKNQIDTGDLASKI